jgi:ABC-type nitrate/sulfonate/bicarbonate transport system permease component
VRRDPGPHPAVRVVLGLALGAALGALIGLVLPRERHMADGHGPAGTGA